MPSKFVDLSHLGTLENVRVAQSIARSGIMQS
jgi:hypothetical protein